MLLRRSAAGTRRALGKAKAMLTAQASENTCDVLWKVSR